jgi:D-arabinose 1-dehydrogenase-like Zn-dependent alcohol dehydrogenase
MGQVAAQYSKAMVIHVVTIDITEDKLKLKIGAASDLNVKIKILKNFLKKTERNAWGFS